MPSNTKPWDHSIIPICERVNHKMTALVDKLIAQVEAREISRMLAAAEMRNNKVPFYVAHRTLLYPALRRSNRK